MTDQSVKASLFEAMHVKGEPVVLYNIWDPGSAQAVAQAGAAAIATGSAPVAMANGFTDGENIPLASALANAERIVRAVDLPVTLDLEGGYDPDPGIVAANVQQALETGVVGFNFEDQIIGGDGLYPVTQQVERVRAARKACDKVGIPAVLNARTDIFLKAAPDTHSDSMLTEAIQRAGAFAGAGARSFFAPGLKDEALIARLCAEVELPVNIIALPGAPANARLAELGVARISYGPVPYRRMVQWLEDEARAAFSSLG